MRTHSLKPRTFGVALLLGGLLVAPIPMVSAAPSGDIAQVYNQAPVRSSFGAARDIARCGQNGGCIQVFRRGKIYQHPAHGTHAVLNGPISRYWEHAGAHMGQYGFPVSDLVTNGDGAVLHTRGADGTNWVFTERAGTVTVTQDTGAVEKKESKPTPAAPKTAAEQITATAQDAFGSDGARAVSDVYRPFGDGMQVQRFAGGVVVFTEASGPVAMHGMVYDHWWKARQFSDFKDREGLPVSWSKKDGVIHTQFERMSLYWDEQNHLARWDKVFGPQDALVIGDSQVWQDSWVGQGIRAAGFKDTMYRCGGTGFIASRPGHCPSYSDGVLGNKWALPAGNPGVIYLDASGNDTYSNSRERVQAETVKVISQLKRMYPNSKIVLGGVLSKNEPHHAKRWEYNETARAAAAQTGVAFLDVKGWVSVYGVQGYMADDLHLKDEHQWRLAAPFASSLRELLGR